MVVALGDRPRTLEQRLARARSWLALELFEPAWGELSSLDQVVGSGSPLRARIRADLLIASYYLARDIDETSFSFSIQEEAGPDAAVIADMHLALAMRATARNDLHAALKELYFAFDAAKLLRGISPRTILAVTRVHAHVLAQAACYADAERASAKAVALAESLRDPWEIVRSVYTRGFVWWCQGHSDEAIRAFDDALAQIAEPDSALARWIRCSRARALGALGRMDEADEEMSRSAHHLPEDVAYLAVVRGEPDVAMLALESCPETDPFVMALLGITKTVSGKHSVGQRLLERAGRMFSAGGLFHYAFGVGVHVAYAKSLRRRGAGVGTAALAAAALSARGAKSFAWPHPALVAWLKQCRSDPGLAAFARGLSVPAEQTSLGQRLRELGLTARESEILTCIRAEPSESRKQLAAKLQVSPSTLRVHLTRIRAKLDVSSRGDRALREELQALEARLTFSGRLR